jgi:DNA polymerase-4
VPFEVIDSSVMAIVDRVTRRLRKGRRLCRTVVLRLRFDDFSRATRSLTMPRLTDQSGEVLAAARALLADAMPLIGARGITLVGVSLTNLFDADRIQLSLPLEARPLSALDDALDEVRERYGSTAVTRATLLGRDSGIAMPLLPD